MSKIRDFVKWADFFVDLKEAIGSIRSSLKSHDEELKELAQQNIRLVERIAYQNREIESLERRILTLEGNAMAGMPPLRGHLIDSAPVSRGIAEAHPINQQDAAR